MTSDQEKPSTHRQKFWRMSDSWDITLDELRIESMFPADEATAARRRTLAQ